jgi:hypothetical protein
MSLSEPPIVEPYAAYVTYDQGSDMQGYPPTLDEIQYTFVNTIGVYYTVFYALFYMLFLPLLIIYYRRRRGRARRKKFISKIIENITGIRRVLRDNNKATSVFSHAWRRDPPTKKGQVQDYKQEKKVQDYIQKNEVQDYIILDDFYAKLDQRNRNLSSNGSYYELKKLNKHLSLLADNALRNIDWGKYT